jgi:hypothetical protein
MKMINLKMDEKTFAKLAVHILTDDNAPPELVDLIYNKLDAIKKRELYSKSKFGTTQEERSEALQEYINLINEKEQ